MKQRCAIVLLALGAAARSSAFGPGSLDPKALKAKLQVVVDEQARFWNASISFAVHNSSFEFGVAAGANDYANAGTSRLTPDT